MESDVSSLTTPRESAMTALKRGTASCHRRLDRRLAGAHRFRDLGRYVEHLGRLAAFQAAAEASWRSVLSTVLSDYPARRKAELLARDVQSLGGSPPPWPAVPEFSSSDAVLGGFYVLEGASLGGQLLLTVVERELGLSAQFGASYLASYGPAVREMWTKFGAEVDAHCRGALAIERAVAAAQAVFCALEDCLCGESA